MTTDISEFAKQAIISVGLDGPFVLEEVVKVAFDFAMDDPDFKKLYNSNSPIVPMLLDSFVDSMKGHITTRLKRVQTVTVGTDKYLIPLFTCFPLPGKGGKAYVFSEMATLDHLKGAYSIKLNHIQAAQQKLDNLSLFIKRVTPLMTGGAVLSDVCVFEQGTDVADDDEDDTSI